MESIIQRNNISVLKKMELASNEAVKQALLAGLDYSIMPLIGFRSELQSNELQIIPIKGKKHSSVSLDFLEYLTKVNTQIVQDKFR
jgi:hypothetical protein